jgi:CheY-like chemotaxis protein
VSYRPERLPDDPGTRAEQRLGGVRILWIDDNPDSVELDAQAMRRAGALVAVANDRAEAERHLAAQGRDLVISDITRGRDHDAGFTDIARLRGDGFYSGPVIFYTGRVTPSREARARELQALASIIHVRAPP